MRQSITSVDDGIPKGFVRVIYADFGTQAPLNTLWRSCLHRGKMLETFFNGVVPVSRGNPVESFFTHLLK